MASLTIDLECLLFTYVTSQTMWQIVLHLFNNWGIIIREKTKDNLVFMRKESLQLDNTFSLGGIGVEKMLPKAWGWKMLLSCCGNTMRFQSMNSKLKIVFERTTNNLYCKNNGSTKHTAVFWRILYPNVLLKIKIKTFVLIFSFPVQFNSDVKNLSM